MAQLLRRLNESLLIPDKNLMPDQNKTKEIQLSEPMIFIGVIYRNVGLRLLIGTDMRGRGLVNLVSFGDFLWVF